MPVVLDISRMTHAGYALRLRFEAALRGAVHALPRATRRRSTAVDAREVDQPGGGEELDEPLRRRARCSTCAAWARDALALALPARSSAARTAPGCARSAASNLNEAGPSTRHEREPDPRWAKLRELRFD